MSVKCSQLNIAEIFDECQDSFVSNNPTFFSLLDECIYLDEFIPLEFYDAFYLSFKRLFICLNCSKDFIYSYRFSAYFSSFFVQETS